MKTSFLSQLKIRVHVHGWFFLINAFLISFLSLRYLTYMPMPKDFLAWLYTLVAVCGQMPLIAAFYALLILPVVCIPNKTLRTFFTAFLTSIGIGILIIDTLVFDQYRFHLNIAVLELVFSGGIVEFPVITWLTVIIGFLILLCLEFFLYQRLSKEPLFMGKRLGRKVTLLIVLCILATHVIHIWGSAYAVQSITNLTRFLPLFYPTTARTFLKQYGLINEKELAFQEKIKEGSQGILNYPLFPLKKENVKKPLNIVLLVIDAFRYDALSEKYSPHLWRLAKKGLTFKNHLSTGNCTRTGIFGLFYGLPGTYWHSFLSLRRPPVLIERLQELDYEMGIFASAHLDMPEFKDTVFSSIPNLRVHSMGSSKVERDIEITDAWLEWNKNKEKNKPSFTFLFYDAPHGYSFPDNYPHKFKPLSDSINYLDFNNDLDPTPLLNRYYTSVHFTDSQIARVINALEASGELENTLIILTGDHSQELNDNKLNFWGHNGNFTDAQIKVPFVIIDPTLPSKENPWNDIGAMTSHEDLAPTLLKKYLGIKNNIKDYSTGFNLFDKAFKRNWLISSSYNRYAIIDKNSILEVYKFGGYQYTDRKNHPKEGSPNRKVLLKAFEAMRHFIH